jgi:hypothetical protein
MSEDARTAAFDKLLAAIAVLDEFWEARSCGDQLDNVGLMEDVLNLAEHAAAGGDKPVCGRSRIVSGRAVDEGGDFVATDGRRYQTTSATCGRVTGHKGLHRDGIHRWADDTRDWG